MRRFVKIQGKTSAKCITTSNMKDCTQSDYMINQITEKSIKGNETTYEIEKQNMNNFITLKQNITLKYANGTCVVSNVES